MVYPQFNNKHLEEALFQPEDFLRYRKFKGLKFPSKYIFTYQSSALRHFRRKYRNKYRTFKLHSNMNLYILDKLDLGFVKMSGIGAPHAGTYFEELIGLGLKKIINIGTAGGLKQDGVFLCNRAIRDEGTSHHYIKSGLYSYPDSQLTKKLGDSLKASGLNFDISTTWTIDAPYRETKAEIAKYKKQGVATVEMEASALFVIAKIRKVRIASAFVVSDTLGEKWHPKFHHINVIKTQNKMIDAAIDCLTNS